MRKTTRVQTMDVMETIIPSKLPVMEIFSSIQGEGSMMGMPVTFIRLAGCNLRCPWCDTKDSWTKPCAHETIEYMDTNEMRNSDMFCSICGAEGSRQELIDMTISSGSYTWETISEIVLQCDKNIVVITGGEPCMHDLTEVIDALHLADKLVCIETNGTLPSPSNADWVVCSPKPMEYVIHGQCFFDELKYVVDENFDVDCVPIEQQAKCGSTWLQPCDYGIGKEEETKASVTRCYMLAMDNAYLRVGIQMHKLLDVK